MPRFSMEDTMVAVAAAEMRRALGLAPWPAFEARQRARFAGWPDPDPLRATGRSTRGAIHALAWCRVAGLGVLHVAGNRHAVRLAKDLAEDLRLPVRVVSGDPERWRGCPEGVLFHEDHLEEARYRVPRAPGT